MKTVYILRAVPGAGKSTIADEIHEAMTKSGKTCLICCADDFFMEDGIYKWDVEKIGHAHLWCKREFEQSLAESIDTIIIANTNTHTSDVRFYREKAIEKGYIVFVLTVENWHNGKDEHNVPDDIKLGMAETIKSNIKLFDMPTVLIDDKNMPKYKRTKDGKFEIIDYDETKN